MQRWLVFISLWILAGCQAGTELALHRADGGAEAEALAGRTAAPLLELSCGGIVRGTDAERVVETIGRRIESASQSIETCQYRILSTKSVNAYSLPGGLVYVTRGLYDRIHGDDALIAAAVSHEMAHIIRKDSLRPPCASSEEALDREASADASAARLLEAAGYSSVAMARLMDVTADVQPSGWAQWRAERVRTFFASSDKSGRVLFLH